MNLGGGASLEVFRWYCTKAFCLLELLMKCRLHRQLNYLKFSCILDVLRALSWMAKASMILSDLRS